MVADDNTKRVVPQLRPDTQCSVIAAVHLSEHFAVDKAKRTDEFATECGRRIKRAREARGWTQAQLAAATGWTEDRPGRGYGPSRISNYEQGTRRIGFEEAFLFERIFGEPAAYFLGVLNEKEAELVSVLRKQAV